MPDTRRTPVLLAVLGMLLLSLSGCGQSNNGTAALVGSNFPMTFENCGATVTIEKPPERVLLLAPDGGLPLLKAVNSLGKVIGIAGKRDLNIYDQETQAQAEPIPAVGTATASGGYQVSLEEIIARKPDVVIGFLATDMGISRETLSGAGIKTIEIPSYCVDKTKRLLNEGFEDVYSQIEFYGRLFNHEKEATAAIAGLRERVAAVVKRAQGSSGKTAAALYVRAGGQSSSAYGAPSMEDALMETLGLANVFGDVPQRNFPLNLESFISKNPDKLIVISGIAEPGEPERSVRALPGADRITAVRNNDILELISDYTHPASPLTVTGLEKIADKLVAKK